MNLKIFRPSNTYTQTITFATQEVFPSGKGCIISCFLRGYVVCGVLLEFQKSRVYWQHRHWNSGLSVYFGHWKKATCRVSWQQLLVSSGIFYRSILYMANIIKLRIVFIEIAVLVITLRILTPPIETQTLRSWHRWGLKTDGFGNRVA